VTALIGFVFFGLFSPGPNVILLTASGARFGFRRTLPHLLGVALGVGVIAFFTGLGLGSLVTAWPRLRLILMVVASLWILWMAWKLWNAKPAHAEDTDRPFTFLQAILFQWVNPKIWAVATSASAMVTDVPPLTQGITLALTFSCTNLGVCLFWTYAGSLLKTLLSDPVKWRMFMRGMAIALALFSALVFL
jgi:threonine/homoserine/homoserine lactone efflux protein